MLMEEEVKWENQKVISPLQVELGDFMDIYIVEDFLRAMQKWLATAFLRNF